MGRFIDMTGARCGRLTVLSKLDARDPLGNVLWQCVCDCGTPHVTNGIGLRHGRVRSCGCLQKDSAKALPITQPESLQDRLDRNCVKGAADECWPWTGVTNPQGYAPMRFGRRGTYAHRLAFELHKGPVPDGLVVMHSCDNPRCVNPAHLVAGTHQDNMDDMAAKGRGVTFKGVTNGRSKLTERQVREIRSSPLSTAKLAGQFGVCKRSILKVKQRISYVDIQ